MALRDRELSPKEYNSRFLRKKIMDSQNFLKNLYSKCSGTRVVSKPSILTVKDNFWFLSLLQKNRLRTYNRKSSTPVVVWPTYVLDQNHLRSMFTRELDFRPLTPIRFVLTKT